MKKFKKRENKSEKGEIFFSAATEKKRDTAPKKFYLGFEGSSLLNQLGQIFLQHQ